MEDGFATPVQAPLSFQASVRRRLSAFQRSFAAQARDIDRRRWVYRRTPGRAADEMPLLMVPGIQGGGDIFFETALILGSLLPLITISAPDIEDVEEMTVATARFLRELGLSRANVVGSSLGGYLAQAFAVRFPNMVEQMVIANGFYDPTPFISKLPPINAFRAMDAAKLVQQNLAPIVNASDADEGQMRLKTTVSSLVGPVQSVENYRSRLLLLLGGPALGTPPTAPDRVLIIDDDHDPMLPPEMREALRARYIRSEQHAIDGGGHLPAVQRPRQFADLIERRFVRDAPQPLTTGD